MKNIPKDFNRTLKILSNFNRFKRCIGILSDSKKSFKIPPALKIFQFFIKYLKILEVLQSIRKYIKGFHGVSEKFLVLYKISEGYQEFKKNVNGLKSFNCSKYSTRICK